MIKKKKFKLKDLDTVAADDHVPIWPFRNRFSMFRHCFRSVLLVKKFEKLGESANLGHLTHLTYLIKWRCRCLSVYRHQHPKRHRRKRTPQEEDLLNPDRCILSSIWHRTPHRWAHRRDDVWMPTRNKHSLKCKHKDEMAS